MPPFAFIEPMPWDVYWTYFGQLLLGAIAFGLVGVGLLALGFKVFERITPRLDVEEQLRQGNIAVGIMVGAVIVAIGVVVAVAVG